MPRHVPASGKPGAGKTRTHTNDGGDEEQHQHGDVEHDDPQQQEQHLGSGGGQSCSGTGMMLDVCVCACVCPCACSGAVGTLRFAPPSAGMLLGHCPAPGFSPWAPPTEKGPNRLLAPRCPPGVPRAHSPSPTEGAPPSPLPGDLQSGGGSPRGHPQPLSPRGVQSPSPTGMYSPSQLRARSRRIAPEGLPWPHSAGKGGRRCLAHPPMGAVWVILLAPTPGGILPGLSALATPGERAGSGEQGWQPLPLSALGPSSAEVPSAHLPSSPPADTLLDPLPSWE